jgi:hypothetical protein
MYIYVYWYLLSKEAGRVQIENTDEGRREEGEDKVCKKMSFSLPLLPLTSFLPLAFSQLFPSSAKNDKRRKGGLQQRGKKWPRRQKIDFCLGHGMGRHG